MKVLEKDFFEVCRRMISGELDQNAIDKLLGRVKLTGLEALPENDLPEAVLLLERHMIMKALHRNDGFVENAAQALKLTRRTLTRKIDADETLPRYLEELRDVRRGNP